MAFDWAASIYTALCYRAGEAQRIQRAIEAGDKETGVD